MSACAGLGGASCDALLGLVVERHATADVVRRNADHKAVLSSGQALRLRPGEVMAHRDGRDIGALRKIVDGQGSLAVK